MRVVLSIPVFVAVVVCLLVGVTLVFEPWWLDQQGPEVTRQWLVAGFLTSGASLLLSGFFVRGMPFFIRASLVLTGAFGIAVGVLCLGLILPKGALASSPTVFMGVLVLAGIPALFALACRIWETVPEPSTA